MSDDVVGPLDRGLAVLRAMSAPGRHRMRPSELARATSLARSTVDRVVATLVHIGYLRETGQDVELAPRLMEIGNAYLRFCGIPDALGPVAERLAEELDESVSIAVPDEGGVRFVTQITRRRTMSLAFRIGDLLPADRCAPGALFAADLTTEFTDASTPEPGTVTIGPTTASTTASTTEPTTASAAKTSAVSSAWPSADASAGSATRSGAEARSGSGAEARSGSGAEARSGSGAEVRSGSGAEVRSGGSGSRYEARFSPLPPLTPRAAIQDFPERIARAAATGWATDDQLIEPGLIAVAVPLRDASGRTVCAVSVVSHTSRHTITTLTETILPRLLQEVPGMEKALAVIETRPGTPPTPTEQPDTQLTALPEAIAAAAAGTQRETDPARRTKREIGSEFLQSLARGLAVMTALGDARRGGLTLSETAEATGLPRATARRAVLTLDQLGYAEQEGRRFRLRPRTLELGYAHLSSLGFDDIVRPHMVRLVEEVHESASMAVLDGPDIRYVARVPTYRIMRVDITVGTRFPAYATSMGRVLLAGLPPAEGAALLADTELRPVTRHTVTDRERLMRLLDEVTNQGYALVDEELEDGLRSLAVPVRDASGGVVAALNIASHAARGTPEQTLAALLPALKDAAANIEADLRVLTERRPLRLP